jgi:hypothetical protein
VKKIDDWRRREPDLPNLSEAIRRLVEMGLEARRRAANADEMEWCCLIVAVAVMVGLGDG